MSTPRELTHKAQEKANYRALKKARWARKSKADKVATIWLYGLLTAFLGGIGGLLLVMVAIAYWQMPWYADVWFTIAFIAIAITWWALNKID